MQVAVCTEFAARIAPGEKVLYLGDTGQKDLYVQTDDLNQLGLHLTEHSKLPDVVIYDPENSLHPDLFAHYINTFLVNAKRSQLIFSTHNLQSMDADDFNIRNGVSFLNAYNAGKFGAKPTLGSVFISKE